MAHTSNGIADTSLSENLLFFNIDQAVGMGGANLRTDVMLVQYFFFKLFHGPNAFTEFDPPPGGGMTLKMIDGKYGPMTAKYISHYQAHHGDDGKARPLVTDGRVDVLRHATGHISGMRFTLFTLNSEFATKYPLIKTTPGFPDLQMPTALNTALNARFETDFDLDG